MKQAKNVEEGGREDSEVDIVNSYDIIIDNYLISNQSEKQYLEEENSQSNNKYVNLFSDLNAKLTTDRKYTLKICS